MAAVPGPGLWLGRPDVPGCRPDPAVGRGGEPEMCAPRRETPGTTIVDGPRAGQGYALNKMFMSFNDAANRAEFLRDEDAYCARYGLNEHQRDAIRRRDMLALVAAGGNAYYLAKFAGVLAAGG